MKEYYRTEMVISALSAGRSLAWDTWSNDALTALGVAGKTNRLGNRLVRFLSDPVPSIVQEITLMLSTKLIKRGWKGNTLDAAFQAFEYWNHQGCLQCRGRGVLNFQQKECPACNGTGKRKAPQKDDMVRDAIADLLAAAHGMEIQLRKLLRNYPIEIDIKPKYVLNLHQNLYTSLGDKLDNRTPSLDEIELSNGFQR